MTTRPLLRYSGGKWQKVVAVSSFRGGPVLKLDDKGRITVPSKFSAVLSATVNGQLVVCKSPDGCLALFPLPVWEKFEAELLELPDDFVGWRRLFVGSATEVEIDSGSRVLIPPELRRWAGFKEAGSVIFMGVGAHFELWDPARSEVRESQVISKGKPEPLRTLVFQ